MKNEGRCAIDEKQLVVEENQILATKWYDNKPVSLISSYCGKNPVTSVKRWDCGTSTEIDIECPAIVKKYDRFMGQVDTIGQLLSLYRIRIDCRKLFYLKFFSTFRTYGYQLMASL